MSEPKLTVLPAEGDAATITELSFVDIALLRAALADAYRTHPKETRLAALVTMFDRAISMTVVYRVTLGPKQRAWVEENIPGSQAGNTPRRGSIED